MNRDPFKIAVISLVVVLMAAEAFYSHGMGLAEHKRAAATDRLELAVRELIGGPPEYYTVTVGSSGGSGSVHEGHTATGGVDVGTGGMSSSGGTSFTWPAKCPEVVIKDIPDGYVARMDRERMCIYWHPQADKCHDIPDGIACQMPKAAK